MAKNDVSAGISVEFRGDTIEFDKSVDNMNKMLKVLKNDTSKLNKELRLDPKNVDLMNQKMSNLKEQVKLNEEELKTYREQLENTKDSSGKVTDVKQWDNLNKKIAECESNISRFNDEMARIEQSIANNTGLAGTFDRIGDSAIKASEKISEIAKATRVASATATATLVGITKASADFEKELISVQKVVDETATTSYADLENQIRDMAKRIPVSMETITNSFANAGQLGISADNIAKFTEVMLQLDTATNITAEEASMQMAQLFNVIGADINNIDKFANSIVRLGNNSATTERDILDMASSIGASASNVKFTEDQILALASALSSAGLQSAGGGSAIARTLTQIDKAVALDSKSLESWAKLSGKSIKQFKKAWRKDASGTFVSIIEGMGKAQASGQNLNVILSELGITSIQQDKAVKALVGSYDTLRGTFNMSADAFENGTDASDEASKAWSTFSAQIQLLKNNLGDIAITLGNTFLPTINDLVKKATEFIGELGKNITPNMSRIIVALTGFMAVLSPLSKIIAMLVGGFGRFSKAISGFFGMLTTGNGIFSSFATAIAGINPTLLAVGGIIAGLVASFIALWKNSEEFRTRVTNLISQLKDALVPIFENLKLILGQVGLIFMDLFGILKDMLMPVLEVLWNAILTILEPAFKVIADVVSVVIEVVAELIDYVSDLWDRFKDSEWYQKLSEGFQFVIDLVNGVIKVFKDVVEWVERAIQAVKDFFSSTNDGRMSVADYRKDIEATTGLSLGKVSSGARGSGAIMDSVNSVRSGGFQSGGNNISLQTTISVNNEGNPIDEMEVRRWGNLITDIVNKNLGRQL